MPVHGAAQPVQGTGEQRMRHDDGEESFVVTKWDRALSRYRAGEPALAAAHTEDEALYDRLGARHDTALKKLLCTPVPTAAELALKLDLTTAHQAWELTGGERCMAALQRDAWRLAGLRRRALAGAHRRDL